MDIEAICRSPSYFDERNIRETMAKIDEVSISLFSLSYYSTGYDDFEWSETEDAPTREQWDTLLANTLQPYSITRPMWEAAGWDITDGKGEELACAHYFTRLIIAVEFGNIDGVELTPDGSGRVPDEDDAEGSDLTEAKLAERLEREAREYLRRRK